MNDLRNDHCSQPAPELDLVILSAGESRRLGQPKQHIILAEQTLLHRSLNLALTYLESIGSNRKPIVISGAYLQQDCQLISRQFHAGSINHHYNHNWRTGMTSSLECARTAAGGYGMMVLLVDQYRLTLTDLNSLYTEWLKAPEKPVAARFGATMGPPVIWPIHLLEPGRATAKNQKSRDKAKIVAMINKDLLRANNPVHVDIEHAATDLDTIDDLHAARAYFHQ